MSCAFFFSGVHSSSDSEVSGDVFGSEWSLSGSESIVVVEGLGWYACSVWECVLVISGRMSSEPGARVRMLGCSWMQGMPWLSMVIVVLGFAPLRIFEEMSVDCGLRWSITMCWW